MHIFAICIENGALVTTLTITSIAGSSSNWQTRLKNHTQRLKTLDLCNTEGNIQGSYFKQYSIKTNG